ASSVPAVTVRMREWPSLSVTAPVRAAGTAMFAPARGCLAGSSTPPAMRPVVPECAGEAARMSARNVPAADLILLPVMDLRLPHESRRSIPLGGRPGRAFSAHPSPGLLHQSNLP